MLTQIHALFPNFNRLHVLAPFPFPFILKDPEVRAVPDLPLQRECAHPQQCAPAILDPSWKTALSIRLIRGYEDHLHRCKPDEG